MKILIVCSQNSGKIAPFIIDQVDALMKSEVECDYYTVKGKGILGYLKNRKGLTAKINSFQPEIIHAHYGLSGLLANLQRKIPVVTTYHGSDINISKIFIFSKICMFLSQYNIFVSEKNLNKAHLKKKNALIPCGVDIDLFRPFDKDEARKQLNFKNEEKIILFAGAFDNPIKNAHLAIEAVKQLNGVKLLELKGYSRQQVALLMNAVDLCLLTSFSEGSPQFIKEAMACNCPIVSVDVGDIAQVIGSDEQCYLSNANVDDLVGKLQRALETGRRTIGRGRLISLGIDQDSTISKLKTVYSQILK